MSSELQLNIKGMTCGSCSRSITVRLTKFDFTSDVVIDWEKGTGILQVTDPFEENKNQILEVISQLGFEASVA